MSPPRVEIRCFYCDGWLRHWVCVPHMQLEDGFELAEVHIYRCGCAERNHRLVRKANAWEWREPPNTTEARIPFE